VNGAISSSLVQRLLWWWRLKALFSLVIRVLAFPLMLSPVVILLSVGPLVVGLRFGVYTRSIVGTFVFVCAFVMLVRSVQIGRAYSLARAERLTVAEAIRVSGDAEFLTSPSVEVMLDVKMRAGRPEGLTGVVFLGIFRAWGRFAALLMLGSHAAAYGLGCLAGRQGVVDFAELAGLFDESVDVEAVITGLAAVRGVVVMLEGDAPGLALGRSLRARLSGGAAQRE
jgi:hypothetical protein